MRTLPPSPVSPHAGHVLRLQRALAWLVCAGLLMCLLGLMVNVKSLPAMPAQASADTVSVAAAHGNAAAVSACSATQLQGTCTDAEPGDWADLDVLPAVPLAMRVVRVLRSVETRTPLIQVGVQPGLPPPRGLG